MMRLSRHKDLSKLVPDTVDVCDRFYLVHGDRWARRVCVTTTGDYLVAATVGNKVFVFDIGAEPARKREIRSRLSKSAVLDVVALHTDCIAVACGDGTAATWNARTGEEISRERVSKDGLTALTTIGDQRLAVGTADGYVAFYLLNEGFIMKQIWRGRVHMKEVTSFHSDGTLLVSGSADKFVVLNQVEKDGVKEIARWIHSESVTDVRLGERWIISSSLNEVRVCCRNNVHKPRIYNGLHGNDWVYGLLLLEDVLGKGNSIETSNSKPFCGHLKDVLITVGGDCSVVGMDLKKARPLWSMSGRLPGDMLGRFNAIWHAALLPDRRLAICGPWDSQVVILDIQGLLGQESVSFWRRKAIAISATASKFGSMIKRKMTEGFACLRNQEDTVVADVDSNESEWTGHNDSEDDEEELEVASEFVPEKYGVQQSETNPSESIKSDSSDLEFLRRYLSEIK